MISSDTPETRCDAWYEKRADARPGGASVALIFASGPAAAALVDPRKDPS